MSVVCIDHPFAHHGRHSGYQILGHFVADEYLLHPRHEHYFLKLISDRWLYRLAPFHPNWYTRQDFGIEVDVAARLFTGKHRIYHFLYGEHSFRWSGKVNRWAGRRNRVVATYHQLPQFFEQRRAQLSHLRDLDAAILVSSNQKRFFDIILGPSRVHIIPHGIDTEFFHPPTDSHKDERPLRCLTVGSNYRDMDLHAQVIRNINRSSLRDVEFVVIGEPRCTDSFVGLDNVTYLSGISDEELLRFYQTTHVLLLPLADATACNALLEGMACGSPILVTDVGGVRDYVDDASAALVPARDPDAMTERLIGLLKDENCREELGARARQRALVRFDWRIIAQQVRQVHAKISAQ